MIRVICTRIRGTSSVRSNEGGNLWLVSRRRLAAEKRIEIALTYIYGIGRTTARRILSTSGSAPTSGEEPDRRDTGKLRGIIERELKVEGALRSEVAMNIKRLMDIGAYRGLRHRRGLPVRGPRTKTNAADPQGPKKTARRTPGVSGLRQAAPKK